MVMEKYRFVALLSVFFLGALSPAMGAAKVSEQLKMMLGTGPNVTNQLTCPKLDGIFVEHPAPELRPFCSRSGVLCREVPLVLKRSPDDLLRREVEEKLAVELRYELDLCEIAIRALDPDYLPAR